MTLQRSTWLPRWARAIAGSALAGSALALVNGALARRAESRLAELGEYLELDGVRLRYAVRGEGQPVVLVHGNGTLIEDWIVSGVFDDLAQTHRVIAFDRPGFGRSARPRGEPWSPQKQAHLLAKALTQLGIGPAIIVGHSIGTQIVVALALDHPQLVARIVLVSGYYYPTRRIDARLSSLLAVPVVGDLMRHTISPWFSRAYTPIVSRVLFSPAKVPQRWKDRFPLELAHRPSQILALSGDAGHLVATAAALCPRYGELGMPVTLITGDGDKVVTPERHSKRLHEELAHSRLIVLPGVGHMAHYLAPGEIAAAVREV